MRIKDFKTGEKFLVKSELRDLRSLHTVTAYEMVDPEAGDVVRLPQRSPIITLKPRQRNFVAIRLIA